MKILHHGTSYFETALKRLVDRYEEEGADQVEAAVKKVLADVRLRGDEALLEYTRKWDGVTLSKDELLLPDKEMDRALEQLDTQSLDALKTARERIRIFHEHQRLHSWEFTDEEGNLLGQKVTPLDRVGVYVPGGKGAYPSSVLMNVMPAKVAGVKEIFVVTPPARIEENPAVLAAAKLAGVDRVYRVGGAQAVAALAYGTESIPRVDKIVGPGNIFVATAKRLVFGVVDIDMIAGPSEVLIITDGCGDPRHLAADLLAQAEHDERSYPLIISTSEDFLKRVLSALAELVDQGPWRQIASRAIRDNGMAFVVPNIEQGVEMANMIAPEHLELAFQDAEMFLDRIRHAGAIFIGPRSAETLGDYLAGPNHVLPTMGTARFFSPLGVYDFIKRSSILSISTQGLARLGPAGAHLARMEGFHAHAEALEMRLKE